jgi:hypothetical protein
MPRARPIRLWAANCDLPMRFSFSSARDHRVSPAIRKASSRAHLTHFARKV